MSSGSTMVAGGGSSDAAAEQYSHDQSGFVCLVVVRSWQEPTSQRALLPPALKLADASARVTPTDAPPLDSNPPAHNHTVPCPLQAYMLHKLEDLDCCGARGSGADCDVFA